MVIRWLICMVFVCAVFSAQSVLAADLNRPDESESHVLPEVTVTAPGDYDYTTLPERDLIERPFTESPGLETSTSVVGRQ